MRRMLKLLAAACIAALCLPVSAQKFKEPTREELQMTADPKAPGAAAVYLYREESTDNHNHYVNCYARIKVLTEKGKEWATVEVPYAVILSGTPIIEGRTIHADGTVVPLTGKASDLLVIKAHGHHVKAAVFNLPSVEVGSILEYRWTVPMTGTSFVDEGNKSDDFYASAMAAQVPEWEVQQDIYVHKEHFYFNPFSDFGLSGLVGSNHPAPWMKGYERGFLAYTQRLPGGLQVSKSPKGDYTLDMTDVPALPREENSPPVESLRYRVDFYLAPYSPAFQYWENESERWTKNLDDFASQTQTIRDAAARICAGADTPEAKARKIYDAVQALDNTRFTRERTAAERRQLHLRAEHKSAQDVWNEKSGSDDELAALYLAVARAAGLEAYGLQLASRNYRTFDPNLLSIDQLDSLIVDLRLDGKDVYLDPGEKLCPFGQIHWSHRLTTGLRQRMKMPVSTPANQTRDAMITRTADLTLDAHGGVTGKVYFLITGPAALQLRQLAAAADAEEVKKQFKESLAEILPQGVTGEVESIDGLESIATNLSAVVKIAGQLGAVTGKRMVLPGFFFSNPQFTQVVQEEKRTTVMDLHYAEQRTDDVVYHAPAGFAVESAPQPMQLPWPNHAAFAVRTQSGTDRIEIKHIYARAFILLDPKDYPALREYYKTIAVNDRQQVVLAAAN